MVVRTEEVDDRDIVTSPFQSQKERAKAHLRSVEEQEIIFNNPERQCKWEGCEKLGTHVIIAIENPEKNLHGRTGNKHSSYNTHTCIEIEGSRFSDSEVSDMTIFKPLYYMCSEHMNEQIESLGGRERVNKLRYKVIYDKKTPTEF